jgi:hypothetical protein
MEDREGNKYKMKEEDPEISTLREGIQEGKELCQKLGKKLTGFISVYEL